MALHRYTSYAPAPVQSIMIFYTKAQSIDYDEVNRPATGRLQVL